MNFNATSLLMDITIMSGLIVFSKFLRTRLKFIQNCYIPAAMLAGIIGIIGGKYVLDVIPFSDQANTYSGVLFVLIFASLFIGNQSNVSFSGMLKKSGDMFFMVTAGWFGLYGVAGIVGVTLLSVLFPGIHDAFGHLVATGFAGGHGSAAAIGQAYVESGWIDGMSVAMTYATIGMLVAIFLGVVLINYATRKGYTAVIEEVSKLPEDVKTGLIPEDKRTPIGMGTVNSMSIDPLTWHASLIFICSGGAIALNKYVLSVIIPQVSLPSFGIAIILGAVLQYALNLLGMGKYVDKATTTRISSSFVDYLVGFGIATINLSIVASYWQPLVIMCVVGVVYNLTFVMFFCKRFFKEYWFEKGMFLFGMYTGVASIGILLLRIVDPEYKTPVLEEVGISLVFFSPFLETAAIAITPIMFIAGNGLIWSIGMLAVCIGCLVVTKLFYAKGTVDNSSTRIAN